MRIFEAITVKASDGTFMRQGILTSTAAVRRRNMDPDKQGGVSDAGAGPGQVRNKPNTLRAVLMEQVLNQE
jgi:hypothetical protein